MATHAYDLALLADTERHWRAHGLRVTERATSHPTGLCRPCTQALLDAIGMATVTGSLGCNASRNSVDGTEHAARWHRAPVAIR